MLSEWVDFEYEVDGKVYTFSISGGGSVTLGQIAEALNLADSEEEDVREPANDEAAEGRSIEAILPEEILEDEQNTDDTLSEAVSSENAPSEAELVDICTIQVSEKTRQFLTGVVSVEFSDPSLVWVGKVAETASVGQIKEANGLDVQYSAGLTEEQIADINAQTVEAEDWALISLLPFASEETLTVTMENGDQFVVKVTDAAYDATIVPATELDGKTGALVRTRNNLVNAVQSTALNYNHLQAVAVTIDTNTNKLTTEGNVQLTEWTFTKVESTQNQYFIQADNGYLNIGAGSAKISDLPQALEVLTSNNQIRIKRTQDNYALNNDSNRTGNGYSSWNGSVGYENEGEWFTVYDVEPIFPVTLHFVKENGSSFITGEVTYADGTPVEIVDGNFKINPEKLVVGEDGIIDLSQFLVNGYTLSNTHKSTWHDINDSTDSYTHSIIGNELKWNNGKVQYRLFYTNHDKAGSWWFDAGMEPTRDSTHWQYNNGSDPSNHTAVSDNDSHPYDYYLVYDPIPTSSSGSSGHSSSGESIEDIGKDKTLTPNGDGTYTMDLSVTTHAKHNEESNGINLIIVFDTSSSMRRSVNNANTQYDENDFKNHEDSRFMKARNALNAFLNNLCPSDNETTELVQLALVDFNYGATTHAFGSSYWTTSASTFMNTLDTLNCPQGTNWAQALDTAKTVAKTKTADNDPTYVLLMTDGAPSQYWDPSSKSSYFVGGEGCYLGARDEARDVVNAGYELYGVFSFGDTTDENNKYLDKLVDYAYNREVHSDHSFYASNPEKLEEALEKIFGVLREKVAHAGVNYHDGIALDTTSTALTNISGTLGSITYRKTGGTSDSYKVVADSSGNATFYIGEDETPHAGSKVPITYPKVTGSSSDEGGITVSNVTVDVYQCTVGDKTYTMPIATLVKNETTKVGDLNWDLSPLGLMEDNATYDISFVVWPDQDAYDYVADLNNGKASFPDSRYPNIVYNESTGLYAALTNTVQEVTYYVATKDSFNDDEETTYTGQYTTNPDRPDPMPLTSTQTEIDKVWHVERDRSALYYLLYDSKDEHGNRIPYDVEFSIKQGTVPYTTIHLPGNAVYDEENFVGYDWSGYTDMEIWADTSFSTHWKQPFAIATGLMLSEGRMNELGLDKNAYPHGTYNGRTYYVLETGHDYTISEPELSYEFDFSSPVYHPMLVDGTLQSVTFTVSETNEKEITISGMTTEADGLGALTIENTLRGYIHLNKVVVDVDQENTQLTGDTTKFTYEVKLQNANAPFTGDHIPWYGINSLFYHDTDYNYYQVEERNSQLQITTESGGPYPATCTSGTFDPNNITGQTIQFEEGGETKTVAIFGNQMSVSNDAKTVTAILKITQAETLNIANVPVDTTFEITEAAQNGYELVSITTSNITGPVREGSKISGRIEPNKDNNITYTNKRLVGDLKIHKRVVYNGRTDEVSSVKDHLKGTYTFTIYTDEECKKEYMEDEERKTITLTIDDTNLTEGATSAPIVGLPVGDYWIKEDTAGHDALPWQNPVHIAVEDGKTGDGAVIASFTNDYSDGEDPAYISVQKTFSGITREEIPENFKIILTDGTKTYILVNGGGIIEEVDGTTAKDEDVIFESSLDGLVWRWKIIGVPEGTTFRISEANQDVTGYTVTATGAEGQTINVPDIQFSVKAGIFHNCDQDTWPVDEDTIFVSAVTSSHGGHKGTIVISKQHLSLGMRKAIENAIAANHAFNGSWNGQFYYYSVDEHPNGFSINGSSVVYDTEHGQVVFGDTQVWKHVASVSISIEASHADFAVTNTYEGIPVPLEIVKVENGTSKPLGNAGFTITKLVEEIGSIATEPGTTTPVFQRSGTTSSEEATKGKLTFDNLTSGIYEIKETKVPDGYVLDTDMTFYIRVSGGKVTWVTKGTNGENQVTWTPKEPGTDGLVTFAAATAAVADNPATPEDETVTGTNATFTVENKPGVALPSTGGPGSNLIYLIGLTFTAFAGAGLVMKKRRRNAA